MLNFHVRRLIKYRTAFASDWVGIGGTAGIRSLGDSQRHCRDAGEVLPLRATCHLLALPPRA